MYGSYLILELICVPSIVTISLFLYFVISSLRLFIFENRYMTISDYRISKICFFVLLKFVNIFLFQNSALSQENKRNKSENIKSR